MGLLAACLWSLPPLFLSFQGVYVTGGHFGGGWWPGRCCWPGPAAWPLIRPAKRACGPWAWGVVGGLGLWSSLLILPLVAASLLGLCLARPSWLLGRGPWLAGLGLLLGAAPLLVWNAEAPVAHPGAGGWLPNQPGLVQRRDAHQPSVGPHAHRGLVGRPQRGRRDALPVASGGACPWFTCPPWVWPWPPWWAGWAGPGGGKTPGSLRPTWWPWPCGCCCFCTPPAGTATRPSCATPPP